MSTGILLITHPGIGSALLDNARQILRNLPLPAEAFEVPFDADLDALLPAASGALRRVDTGDGVLILVDMHGASPSQLAQKLTRLGTPCKRVAGVSLPMLLRVMNYPEQDLAALQSTASLGGRNAVLLDDPV
ncbi:PTS fructose IIA subunit family protein [Lysobacteraceae bacterium NML08-0793]|nr:PTS fructose IIA subunit family protein [Xanthomonadaceae bacterium NML08-0793]